MRRSLPLPAVLALVAAAVAITYAAARPKAPPLPPVDFSGEVTVRRALGPTERYRPHAVHVDDRPVLVAPEPLGDAPVTVLTLSGGRVQVAATEVRE